VHNYASLYIKVVSGVLGYDVLPEGIPVLLREFGKLCLADEKDAGYFVILRKMKITLLKKEAVLQP
jgi:hypothetical protein